MNEYQKEGYKNDAEKIEHEMREHGYLPVDIVAVAYFLLENNIEKAEKLVEIDKNLDDILQRVQKILKG
ncbi:hypothetical protein PQE70_gp038 [Bacillus phage vB_BanS_Nate]|uniref:Uncharacterized protein n=1 Tax=Bacillus phage vB_BanS_Nate TaxID=2894788 RepID=A0AAE8YVP8_9CAUD|nr:hypothetical protein PQE70_gp038 [Bacillus phage vB_BanS_Nate]UGO50891.1 hypothetical protein NATE_38 [Bacillus phage vB_BanS_Nate]